MRRHMLLILFFFFFLFPGFPARVRLDCAHLHRGRFEAWKDPSRASSDSSRPRKKKTKTKKKTSGLWQKTWLSIFLTAHSVWSQLLLLLSVKPYTRRVPVNDARKWLISDSPTDDAKKPPKKPPPSTWKWRFSGTRRGWKSTVLFFSLCTT